MQLRSTSAVPSFWIGTARRRQLPVRPRRLHGLFAEPVVTRSGYAGAAAYFLGEDDRVYTASDVRPGDAQLARDAYHGGVEIGPLVQPAKQLARGLYVGADLTASLDGRLGRGKGVKIVEQGESTWRSDAVQARFQRALHEQWNAVHAAAALPDDARPAGWDFVFLAGSVIAALGAELLFQATGHDSPIRLAIASESESLRFRENLRMLSHAPGLRLQVVARMDLQEPGIAQALAAAPIDDVSRSPGEPRLEIPATLVGRVCLGFDEIQRHWLIGAQPAPVVLGTASFPTPRDQPLDALKRRWIAALLSGMASQRQRVTNTLAAETSILHRGGFATGAALLDALGRSDSATHADTFLAVAAYLRRSRCELARSRAMLGDS